MNISKKIIGALLLTFPLVVFSSTKSVLEPPINPPLNAPINTLIPSNSASADSSIKVGGTPPATLANPIIPLVVSVEDNTIESEEMIMCLKFHKDGEVTNIYNSLSKILELEKTKYSRISSDLTNQLTTTSSDLEALEYVYETNRVSEEEYNYKREDIILQYLLAYDDYVTQLSTLKLQYSQSPRPKGRGL